MAKLNFLGWGLVMILILTMINFLMISVNISAYDETNNILGTSSEEDYINSLLINGTTSADTFRTSLDSEVNNGTTQSIANSRNDNPLFQDSGFRFADFIKRMPALLSFSVLGTSKIANELPNLAGIGKILIILLLLPLNLFSTYVLYKFIFGSSRLD